MTRNSFGLFLLVLLALPCAADEAKPKKSNWLQKLSTALPDSGKSADVAGVRGLQDSDVKIVGSSARDYAAIDDLESLEITDEELNQFAVQEKLK